jgi:dienelactone hydrolase
MANSVSQALVKYTPPTSPYVYVRDNIIQRMGTAFEQGATIINNILKGYPEFAPYAFDVAMHIEKEGDKQTANKMRRVVASVIKVSPSSPSQLDEHFLTPSLTGKYPVGVKSFFLEDTSRNEKDLGHHIDRTRRLEMEVYYPATQTTEPKYKVHPPLFFGEHEKLDNLWTRSQPGINPCSEEKFPVVIFSHGWGCNHDDYQQLIEELASHGFCVITLNHPFSNFVSYFSGNFPEAHDSQQEIGEEKAVQEVGNNKKDIEFIIQQIKEGHIEGFHDFLGENINLGSIGVMGHSLGGAAALQTCRSNSSIRAGINLDGPCDEDPSKKETITQPFLTVVAGSEDFSQRRGWRDGHPIYPKHELASECTIPNARHPDFTSMTLSSAIHEKQQPPIEAMETYKQTNSMVVEFFTKHLK